MLKNTIFINNLDMFKYIDIHMMHVNAKIHTLIIQLYGKDPVINFTQVGSFLKK